MKSNIDQIANGIFYSYLSEAYVNAITLSIFVITLSVVFYVFKIYELVKINKKHVEKTCRKKKNIKNV